MKVYMWGTGRLAGIVLGKDIDDALVTAFIDSSAGNKEYMGKQVYLPEEVVNMEYDAILVANIHSKEIYNQCKDLGIDVDKVIFLFNNLQQNDMNRDYEFVERILGTQYARVVKERSRVVRGVEVQEELCLSDSKFVGKGYLESDYVRMKCFELAVKEIRKRNLDGAVAELGVYKGEFAQYINYAFPEKKCYLFDTFSGFDAEEFLKEIKNGNCSQNFAEAFKDTNVESVIGKMTNLENVIIKQGYFPESLNGLEEKFVFVSIDVDFEDSIYAGLQYFWPRLEKGGYIFIHDYNSYLRGVEKAVDRYELDNNVILSKVPLCDPNGTLVIVK